MLILTSDFPSTLTDVVADSIRRIGVKPVVAWIPPLTTSGRERFPAAQAIFRSLGVHTLEFCDIDEQPDEGQLARLDRYDALYFTGGDPILFRRNVMSHGLSERVRAYLASGRVIVAASGGAMQLTRNVSLYRLLSESVDRVVTERDDYDGLGLTDYELLPHSDKLDAAFVDKVRDYSQRSGSDVVALEDGAAVIHLNDETHCIGRRAIPTWSAMRDRSHLADSVDRRRVHRPHGVCRTAPTSSF